MKAFGIKWHLSRFWRFPFTGFIKHRINGSSGSPIGNDRLSQWIELPVGHYDIEVERGVVAEFVLVSWREAPSVSMSPIYSQTVQVNPWIKDKIIESSFFIVPLIAPFILFMNIRWVFSSYVNNRSSFPTIWKLKVTLYFGLFFFFSSLGEKFLLYFDLFTLFLSFNCYRSYYRQCFG